jgi:hypothetical protein
MERAPTEPPGMQSEAANLSVERRWRHRQHRARGASQAVAADPAVLRAEPRSSACTDDEQVAFLVSGLHQVRSRLTADDLWLHRNVRR